MRGEQGVTGRGGGWGGLLSEKFIILKRFLFVCLADTLI